MNTQMIAVKGLEKNEKAVITIETVTKSKKPNYFMIGNGTMNKHKIQSINLVSVTAKASAPARELITTILDLMVFDPSTQSTIFVVNPIPTIHIQPQTLKKGYKELHALDIVRRVKRGYYMLNPNAIITDYDRQIEVWDSIQIK